MKTIVAFFLGIVVGAAAALLYAPVAGEELRGQIATQAEAEWERAQIQWQRSMQGVQDELARMQTQLQTMANKEEAEAAEAEA